jgi:hypothetical protein
MVPFDPVALLAMLQAFYPVVGPAALQRARRERPEYFAAGDITGSEGDKLTLPDGRIFDLIFRVNDPFGQSRWQAIWLTGGGTELDDPFALEPGPLVPVDLSAYPPSTYTPTFVPLIGSALLELGASPVVLDNASAALALHSSPAAFDNDFARAMDPADAQLAAEGFALNAADPSDVLIHVGAAQKTVDIEAGVFDEPAPPEMQPGPPPGPIEPPDRPNQPEEQG